LTVGGKDFGGLAVCNVDESMSGCSITLKRAW
jgi:hypothetical protein